MRAYIWTRFISDLMTAARQTSPLLQGGYVLDCVLKKSMDRHASSFQQVMWLAELGVFPNPDDWVGGVITHAVWRCQRRAEVWKASGDRRALRGVGYGRL